MQSILKLSLRMILCFAVSSVLADSPLTSTDFYQSYMDYPVVEDNLERSMNKGIFVVLRSDAYELDVKVAVINGMGWTFEGQDNAAEFMEFYAAEMEQDVIEADDMSGENLLLLAYMVSMDDYFNMSPIETGAPGVLGMSGVELTEAAAEMVPDDFTVQLISALILAQEAMDYDWGEVFEVVDRVMKEPLARNMRKEAIDIILDYIGLYYGY